MVTGTSTEKALENKDLKAIHRKTKLVSGSITKDGLSKNKVDACGVCSLKVKGDSVLFVQCCTWIQRRCAGVKMASPKFLIHLACRKCKWNIVKVVE